MTDPRSDNELTRVLLEGDPLAHDSGLPPQERDAMRRTILSAVPERAPGFWQQLSPALSTALLLALALAIAWWPSAFDGSTSTGSPGERTTPRAAESPPAPGMQQAGSSAESRKIQFETPGGTLVVWVLDPNFPS